MLQVLDPLGLLRDLAITLGELTPQVLDFLRQPFLGALAWPPPLRLRHASHGTPIGSTCTDPLNCYTFAANGRVNG